MLDSIFNKKNERRMNMNILISFTKKANLTLKGGEKI